MNHDHPIISRSGCCAAVLGVAAGGAEVLVGTAPWLGNKNDPNTLGLVTILLALVIGAAAVGWRWATTTPRVLAVATGMLVPGLLGITTAGMAWLPAAVAAVVGGTTALRHGGDLQSVRRALSEQWPATLLGCLALVYLALGITARGLIGGLAVGGSLAIVSALLLRHRHRTASAFMLLAGTLPFALVAWSSVVPPVTGILILVVGLPLVATSVPRPCTVDDRPSELVAP